MKPFSSPWVREVKEEDFEAQVIHASDETPVVVDFWSPTCGPCRTLGPILERLTHELKGKVLLAKVNTDECPQLASYFRISAVPAVKVIHHRQLVHEFEGLQPEPALREFFAQVSQIGADPEMLAAQEAEETAPARAEKLYREMIQKNTEKLEARVGLARVLLKLGKFEEIPDLLEPVGTSGEVGVEAESILARLQLQGNAQTLPDEKALRHKVATSPGDAQARLDLGNVLASRGAFTEALPMLLSAAELDSKLASGPAREAMVKVFYAIGSNHPLANEYRSKLSRLLY